VECLGESADSENSPSVGDKVIVYPYEGVPHRFGFNAFILFCMHVY